MKQIMAVISSEYRFSERFCDYVNKTGHIVYTAVPFESVESLEDFRKGHNVPILLCDEGMISKEFSEGTLYGVRTVPLCDSAVRDTGRKAVFKYQSAEAIVREIMETLGDIKFSTGLRITGRPVSVQAVYSPVSDEYKTWSAMAVALALTRNRRTLYLNFEEMSGFMKMLELPDDRGMSEAFYYLKQGDLTPERTASLIHTSGPLQFIPPFRTADDLSMINGEDCVNLIRAVFAGSSYDAIVADLPPHLSLSMDVLDVSENVYIPYLDERNDVRMNAFFENLRLSEKDVLMSKMRKIILKEEELPKRNYGQGFTASLLYSTFGDHVTGVVDDEDE